MTVGTVQERTLLLNAGVTVIRRLGAAAMTVQDVLGEASMGTRAFYRHFPSKDAFLVEIWRRESAKLTARLRVRVDGAGGGWNSVVAWIDERLDRTFDRRGRAQMSALWREGFWLRLALPTEVAALNEPQVEVLRDVLAGGLSAEPTLDAATIHATLWMLAERRMLGHPVSRAAARAQLLRVAGALTAQLPQVSQ